MKEKHLDFIQNIISRMANTSFIIKSWSVTLVVGIVEFSLSRSSSNLIYIAFLSTPIFWGLDAYYLRQERLFRKLYNHVLNDKVPDYSLDTKPIENEVDSWLRTIFSRTLLLFYGIIIIVILIIGIWSGT